MSLNILEPEKEKKTTAFRVLGISIIVTTAVALGLLVVSFFSYQQVLKIRKEGWKKKIESLQQENQKLTEEEDKIVAFQTQLKEFQNLISQYPYYSVFFSSFERALLKNNLTLTELKLEKDKNNVAMGTKIELSGAVNSLTNLSFLLTSLKEAPLYDTAGNPVLENDKEVKLFDKVEAKSVSYEVVFEKPVYKFSLTLTPSSRAFKKIEPKNQTTSPNTNQGTESF